EKRYFQRILDYFPSIENDASKITWAHAVNSHQELNVVLKSQMMFIEADVLIGRSPTSESVAIMAHPPNTSSDLDFTTFLQLAKSSEKGLKLDFKDINAVQSCVNELELQKEQINGPILLNADIVHGGFGSREPINAEKFLHECLSFSFNVARQLTIGFSIGWTTTFSPLMPDLNRYTWSTILNMYRTVTKDYITKKENYSLLNFEITYPIRASWAVHSFYQLHWLTDLTKSGLTFWSPVDEFTIKDYPSLLLYRSIYSKSLVYYDLPSPIDKYIQNNFYNDNYINNSLESFPSMKDFWQTDNSDDILLSQFSALLLKSHVFLRTKQTSSKLTNQSCNWIGTIEFLEENTDSSQAVLCYLAEINDLSKAGMTITIWKNGTIELIYQNNSGTLQIDKSNVLPSSVYSFKLIDMNSSIQIEISSDNPYNLMRNETIPVLVKLTAYLDPPNTQFSSSLSVDNSKKAYHAAVMGRNIDSGLAITKFHIFQHEVAIERMS
ncbi:unnamed protein product, partial [Didymodactylos carnosus]